MSSFKKLSKADITMVPYAANKQWSFDYTSSIPNDDYMVFSIGKKEDFSISGTTTTNNLYQSSIYDSMNHLFYQEYTDLLDTGSIMFDVNTYQSASQQRPTSSYFNYNINPNQIKNFPTGAGEQIGVLSINQNIFGSKLLPHSFKISSSLFNITDDGYGNINDVSLCNSYVLGGTSESIYAYKDCITENIVSQSVGDDPVIICGLASYGVNVVYTPDNSDYYYNGICSSIIKEHVGNIFYAHGIVVVTNQNYINLFPTPPTPSITSSVYLHSLMGPTLNASASGTGSLYYKIDSGSYNFVGSVYEPTGNPCLSFGSVSVPSGSTLYISVTSASLNVNFGITEISCSAAFTQPYCGNASPYSVVVTSSMDITISPAYALTGSGFKLC